MFDHRNASLLPWLIEHYLAGPTGLGSKDVEFLFLDDLWDADGPSEVGPNAVALMGLSVTDVTELTEAYWGNMRAMQRAIVGHGGFEWHSFIDGNGGTAGVSTSAGPPFSPAECTTYMRGVACRPDSVLQRGVLFYGFERGQYH